MLYMNILSGATVPLLKDRRRLCKTDRLGNDEETRLRAPYLVFFLSFIRIMLIMFDICYALILLDHAR